MYINAKSATAAAALLIGAGAYPFTATAQSDSEQVEVEVQEVEEVETTEQAAEEVEQTAEEAGQEVEQAAEEAGQEVEQAAEETGETMEQTTEEAAETVEQTVEPVEVDTSDADLEESQKQELEQAAAEGKQVPRPELIIGVQKEGEWLASNLMDREVTNQNDEGIGDISDLIIAEDGPKGVVVDVGGFLGLGEKQVALKWGELQFSEEAILVDATEEQLENAPEYMTLEEKRAEAEALAQQQQLEAEQAATAAQEGEALPPADQQTTQESETLDPATTEEAVENEGEEVEVEVEQAN